MDDWKKCFSKSRNRDYYFNQKTGKSVWTFEETQTTSNKDTNSSPKSNPIKSDKSITSNKTTPQTTTVKNIKRLKNTADPKKSLSPKIVKALDPKQLDKIATVSSTTNKATNSKPVKNEEVDEEPMELDDIVYFQKMA